MRIPETYGFAISAILVFVLAGLACLPYWNQFQGDAFIHFVYARNIAHGYFMQFTPGQITPGTTAPAWTLLMAGVFKLFKQNLPIAARFIGLGFHGLSGVMALYFARDLFKTSIWPGLSAGLLVALNPFLAMWAPTGMETPAVVFLILLGFFLFHRRKYGLAGGVFAITCLLRPETLLLVVLLIMAKPKKWLALLLPSASVMLLWWGITYAIAGTPFPASWAARRLAELRSAFTINLGPLAFSPIPLVMAGAHGPLVSLAPWGRNKIVGLALLLMLVFFVFTFPASTYPGRYLAGAIGLVCVVGSVGWARALPKFKWMVLPISLITLIPAYKYTLKQVSDHQATLDTFKRAAQVLNQDAAPGQVLLAHEVQIAWFIRPDIKVLSLDGVIDGKAVDYLARGSDMQDFILDTRPDYWFTIKTPLVGYWSRTVLRSLYDAMILELLMHDDMSLCIDQVCYTLIGPGLYALEYHDQP